MNTTFKHMIAGAVALCAAIPAFGQASYSGYFLDNYTHRFELNPALTDTVRKGFVAFPVLGNMDIAMQGNVHTTSIFKQLDGKTVLFTNPGISTADALGGFHNKNMVGANLNLDIISVGFKAFGGQNAVTIGAVADLGVMAPGDLFKLVKEGVANRTYDIKNVRANASAYAKVQLNHARAIKQVPGLRVGAAMKFLLGAGNIDAYFRQAELELGTDSWKARTNADIYTSWKGAEYKLKRNDNTGHEYVDGIELNGFGGLSGFGLAFDLGASYKWRDFEFSAALLDLGFISWGGTIHASTNGVKEIDTDAYTFEFGGDKTSDTWDQMRDDFSALYELEDDGEAGSRCRATRATLNFAASYTLPQYRRLKFGLVNSTRFNGPWTATEFRFSANVQPVNCLSASANFVAGTYGVGFGWLLNLNVKGFSLFAGMDHTMGKLAKQGVPLNSNANVNFGINFPF